MARPKKLSRCHHVVAAARTPAIKSRRAKPSRWWAGSKSLTPLETNLITAPSALAMARQIADKARAIPPKNPLDLVLFFLAISVNRIRKRNPKQFGSPSYFYNNRNNHRTSAMFAAYPTANSFSHYL